MWHGILKGTRDFPWGSVWGGADFGDMNSIHDDWGWSVNKITHSYLTVGYVCMTILIAHYAVQIVLFMINPKTAIEEDEEEGEE
jgi:hypothetical protein